MGSPSRNQDTEIIMFITDSRGKGLVDHLSTHLTAGFTILPYSGASLIDSVGMSLNHLHKKKWTQIYLLSGLCSITQKDGCSKIVSPRYGNSTLAESSYRLEALQSIELIKSNSDYPHPKCVLGPITGMNLDCYNSRAKTKFDTTQQTLLNETVVKINQLITEINTSNEVVTPWTSRLVHKRNRNLWIHNYSLIASDGCHLSDRLRSHWADALSVAIVKNT